MGYEFHYKPDGAVLSAFMKSAAFFRGIRGPVASGKSVVCAVELFRLACEQAPDPQTGIRYTRWGVVRNTNPQLKTTTIKTWLEWFPEHVFGKFNWSPPYTHRIRLGDIDMEVIFLALDTDSDVRKLLSLEATGFWINEAREVPKPIVDACTMRVNRFPSRRGGAPGPTHPCIIADTNSPADDHWWPIMCGDSPAPEHFTAEDLVTLNKPDNWTFFTQPPAMLERRNPAGELIGYDMNPKRENKRWIPDQYFLDMLQGKSREWINVYILNRYGNLFEGRPVYQDFNSQHHIAAKRLEPIPGHVVYCGMDFGLTPAATFGQKLRNRWLVQRELVTENMGTYRFAVQLAAFIRENYPGNFEFIFVGDPAGDQRAQTDERTPLDILRAQGINCRVASTNDPELRIAAVTNALTRMTDGVPGYLVSPCCKQLIAAKEGGYYYKEGQDRPEKNRYSHVSDAEQYMMDGAGDLRSLIRHRNAGGKPAIAPHRFMPGQGVKVARWRSPSMR